ncbi:MAG: hypothetical protein GY832_22480 [Chloroflexi bacterium]|nr:hypothetical protein [Chloroflexota bacterium]
MAKLVHVSGAALVKISQGGGAYQELGYTRNGVDLTFEAFFLDVPGDQNGGDEGPPIEVQYLGEIARVRMELTKFDMAVTQVVHARVANNAAGNPATPGTLLLANAAGVTSMDLLILTDLFPFHFPVAIPRQPIEENKGTKFETFVCEFECHKEQSTGVLWDRSLSG